MFDILKKVSFRETKVVSRFALVSFCETKVVSSSNLAKFGGFFFLCLGFKAQKKLFFGPNSPYAGFQGGTLFVNNYEIMFLLQF